MIHHERERCVTAAFLPLQLLVLAKLNIWRGCEAQLTYSMRAIWMDDPETYTTLDPTEYRWKTLRKDAQALGLTFAGKAQFPWIVDIRVTTKDQEHYSVGNLIKQDTVLTTCRAIDDLGDVESVESGLNQHFVYFAQMYLFEYTERDNPGGQVWSFGGQRKVVKATKNGFCNIQQYFYDGGIITLDKPITPAPPTIGTIQLSLTYQDMRLADVDMSKMERERRICYVASFGRDFANIQNSVVKNFKVKYRVYYEQPDMCYRWMDAMCPNRHLGRDNCDVNKGGTILDAGKELWCFKSRAKVGTVCDHDKGAPLVCDGQVFGMVILGARLDHCNDLLAMPFWVQKISMFRDYFEDNDDEQQSRSLNSKSRRNGSSANLQADPITMLEILYYLVSLSVFQSS